MHYTPSGEPLRSSRLRQEAAAGDGPAFSTHSPSRRSSADVDEFRDDKPRASASAASVRSARPSSVAASQRPVSSVAPATSTELPPIPEEALLREIVYVMLGSEAGEFAKWSSDGCYVLTAGSTRQRNIFAQLQEGGVLRRKVSRLLTTHSPSFLQQSLKKAVERQLEQHDLFVASLRDKVPMHLGDLEIAHRKSLPKLHALYVILKESEAVKGGELVTRLQSLHNHGGRSMALFLGDVYREAVRPLLHMTMHWITKGEITDPYLEFFISENHRVKESESHYWSSRFTLREDMLPATITRDQAKNVLLVGKNIDFIRRCLRAKDWKMAPDIVAKARSCSFEDPASLDEVINEALDHTNAAVLHILYEKNNFSDVLHAARSLLLVATGDLWDAIVIALEDTLSSPLLQINTSIVKEQIHSAASDISAYLTPAERDAVDYVQVVFEEDGNRLATGFDSFSITLPFVRPHHTVLHEDAAQEYRRLFRFLYRVKRAEVLLKRAWHQAIFMMRSPHTRDQSPAIRDARQASVTLYKHFNGFVVNVQMYLMTEAIQTSWAELGKALNKAKSLDDVIAAHDAYQASLAKYALLDAQYAAARGEIMRLLDLTFEYCTLQRQLSQVVATSRDATVPALLERYRKLFDDFHTGMSRLLTLLEEDAMHFDFLQALGARLNFNNFYHVDPDSVTADF